METLKDKILDWLLEDERIELEPYIVRFEADRQDLEQLEEASFTIYDLEYIYNKVLNEQKNKFKVSSLEFQNKLDNRIKLTPIHKIRYNQIKDIFKDVFRDFEK